jgi:hypothetical protein
MPHSSCPRPVPTTTLEPGYNVMKGTEYYVSLSTSVVITKGCNIIVKSQELIATTVYLTLYTRCPINPSRYKRVRLHLTPMTNRSAPNKPNNEACALARRLSASLSPRRSGLDPSQVHVGLLMDKVAVGQAPLSITPPIPHSHISFICHKSYTILTNKSVVKLNTLFSLFTRQPEYGTVVSKRLAWLLCDEGALKGWNTKADIHDKYTHICTASVLGIIC